MRNGFVDAEGLALVAAGPAPNGVGVTMLVAGANGGICGNKLGVVVACMYGWIGGICAGGMINGWA